MTTHEVLVRTRQRLTDPGAWVQGMTARDAGGEEVSANSPRACAWCLVGGLVREADRPDVSSAACDVLAPRFLPYLSAIGWNDNPARTHAEVLALLDAGIAETAGGDR